MSINQDTLLRVEEKLDAICRKLELRPLTWKVVKIIFGGTLTTIAEVDDYQQAKEHLRVCYEKEKADAKKETTDKWTQTVHWQDGRKAFNVHGFSSDGGSYWGYEIKQVWVKED